LTTQKDANKNILTKKLYARQIATDSKYYTPPITDEWSFLTFDEYQEELDVTDESISPHLPDETSHYRIVHFSDLHFGRHFSNINWELLINLLKDEYKPNLLVITGDIRP
jgi:hypothetical protein